ncbi:MAG: hypothetical protein N2Z84_02315 [Atribacterota bacterium]|nr:hypothetical protein [Atribacterota bacterium]
MEKKLSRIGFLVSILSWLVLLGGCLSGEEAPLACQDIRGIVQEIDRRSESEGSILVIGDVLYDRAVLRVVPGTSFFREVPTQWERVSFSVLQVGDTVEACFGGPVMESYPVQVVVRQVVILDVP